MNTTRVWRRRRLKIGPCRSYSESSSGSGSWATRRGGGVAEGGGGGGGAGGGGGEVGPPGRGGPPPPPPPLGEQVFRHPPRRVVRHLRRLGDGDCGLGGHAAILVGCLASPVQAVAASWPQ